MKKILYSTALLLVVTSCFNPKGWQEQQEQQEKKRVEVTYYVNCSQDMIDAIDLVVTYKGKDGVNLRDTVRDTLWKKTVVHDVIPAKVALNWSLTPKPADVIHKDTLELRAYYSMTYNDIVMNQQCPMLWYKDIPASRLQALCDLVNLERENLLSRPEKKNHYWPGGVIKSGIYQDLEVDEIYFSWDDE